MKWLSQFAHIGAEDWETIARAAAPEYWGDGDPKQPYSSLEYYCEANFEIGQAQSGQMHLDPQGEFAVWRIGRLFSAEGLPLYVYFTENPRKHLEPYRFKQVLTGEENGTVPIPFRKIPTERIILDDLNETLAYKIPPYRKTYHIVIDDMRHLVLERPDRLLKILPGLDPEKNEIAWRHLLTDAITEAHAASVKTPKLAVPHFFIPKYGTEKRKPGVYQYYLPVHLNTVADPGKPPDLVAAIEADHFRKVYNVKTLLPPEWAYRAARCITTERDAIRLWNLVPHSPAPLQLNGQENRSNGWSWMQRPRPTGPALPGGTMTPPAITPPDGQGQQPGLGPLVAPGHGAGGLQLPGIAVALEDQPGANGGASSAGLEPLSCSVFYPPLVPLTTWETLLVCMQLASTPSQDHPGAPDSPKNSGKHRRQATSTVRLPVAPGTEITVVPRCPGIGINFRPGRSTFTWQGDQVRAQFEFKINQNVKRQTGLCEIAFYAGALALGSITFTLRFDGLFTPESDKTQEEWLAVGDAHYQAGRFGRALAAYTQAIELARDEAMLHDKQGLALYRLKSYREALNAFEQAIRLDPQHAVAYCHKGDACRKLEKLDDALQAYADAAQRDQQLAAAYLGAGHLYRHQQIGQVKDAVDIYCEAIRQCPPDAVVQQSKAYLFLGGAYRQCGQVKEALAAYEESIRLHPTEYNQACKSHLLLGMGSYAEGLAAAEQSIACNVNYSFAWACKGYALAHLGEDQASAAQEAYGQARRLGYDREWMARPGTVGV